MPKLLFLAGSARKDSYNKKLARCASLIAQEHGAEASFIDLADFEMPIYDGDLEEAQGLPENAKKLKALFAQSDGFFIAAPEYNSSIAPLLKNALDWISRGHEEGEAPLIAYRGKVAAISAASPGGFGGLRGLVPLRMMLGNIGVFVTPSQLALAKAHEAFTDEGALKDDGQTQMLTNVVRELVETAQKLKA